MRRLSLALTLLLASISVAFGATPQRSRMEVHGSGPAVTLQRGLVGHWKLDEASGSRYDASGSHNTLTSNNSVGQATGIVLNAASFVAASNQSLSIASNASLALTRGSFSIAMWVKQTSLTSEAIGGKTDGVGIDSPYFIFTRSGTNQYEWRTTDGTLVGDVRTPNGTYTANTWHFLVCSYDSINKVMSIQADNGVVTTTSFDNHAFTSNVPVVFGVVAGSTSYDGLMDNIMVASRLWTADETTYLYNSGFGRALP